MDFEKIKKIFANEQEKKLFNTFNEQIEKKTFTKIKLTCDDFYSCPFCNDYGMILENLEELQITNLECPKCNKKSCLKCKRLSHGNTECIMFDADTDNDKIRHIIQDEISKILIHRCPHCNASYTKTDGCNLMTCSTCGKLSCYICGIKLEIVHGSRYHHFNVEKKCPLWDEGKQADINKKVKEKCARIYQLNCHNEKNKKIILDELKKNNISIEIKKINTSNNVINPPQPVLPLQPAQLLQPVLPPQPVQPVQPMNPAKLVEKDQIVKKKRCVIM
jgi:TRIAD3 protein (E3 ubiquitin-protein ligase RNF216)